MENNPGKWRNIGYSRGGDRAEGLKEKTLKLQLRHWVIYRFDTGFLQANMPFVPVNFSLPPPHCYSPLLPCLLPCCTHWQLSLLRSLPPSSFCTQSPDKGSPRLAPMSLSLPLWCTVHKHRKTAIIKTGPWERSLSWGHCDQLLWHVVLSCFACFQLYKMNWNRKNELRLACDHCGSDIAQAHF